jgi:hypothetical protein
MRSAFAAVVLIVAAVCVCALIFYLVLHLLRCVFSNFMVQPILFDAKDTCSCVKFQWHRSKLILELASAFVSFRLSARAFRKENAP